MKYVPPVGQPADTPYENFDPANGVDGSVVPAEAIEHPQREIINALLAMGVVPDGAKLNQLAGLFTAFKQSLASLGSGQAAVETDLAALELALAKLAARKINTTAPLSGGGDLSADRTFKLNSGKGLKLDANLLTLAIAAGSALVFKGNELDIDFSQMPTDKFEAMLKSIRVPLWLAKNTEWYVDPVNGVDAGNAVGSSAAPWKTIQYALNYITDNYNFSAYRARLNLKPGTHLLTTPVTIPAYSASTGYLHIAGGGSTPYETVIKGSDMALFQTRASGSGLININNITFDLTCTSAGTASTVKTCLLVQQASQMAIWDCVLRAAQPADGIGALNVARVSGGQLTLGTNSAGNSIIVNAVPWGVTGASFRVLNVFDRGQILHSGNCDVAGAGCNTFFYGNEGTYNRHSTFLPVFNFDGSFAARRYYIMNGGRAMTQGGGENFFPGTVAGTAVESPLYN